MIIGVDVFLKDLFGILMFPEVLKQSMESSSSKIQLGQLRLIPPGLGLLVLVVGYEVA